MKINALEIDGFGVWSGLKVEGLSDGLNVFYGPNEAGKTTLLQFIRSMFYGFPPRRRYLPPVHGGRAGGSVEITGPSGCFQIGRHEDSAAEGGMNEQLTLTAPDGTRQGEHFLRVLLCNVDEPIFNNVFAVGLRDIQELGALGDTEAAELLYSLTAGLDRVSLLDVMRELETSRNRILEATGKSCQIVQMLAEREKLQAEIEELAALSRRYAHLAAERSQLERETARSQEEINCLEQQAAVLDLAIALRERWAQRASLDEQLSSLGALKPMPERAIERFDALQARLQKHQRRIAHWAAQRETLKRELADLAVNESLWRQAARIEAFKEQEPWIAQLQAQVDETKAEIAGLESRLAEEGRQLGLGSHGAALPSFTKKTLASLRSPAKILRQCRRQRVEAANAAAAAGEAVKSLTQQVESALAARGEHDLTAAMDRAGNLVLQLRRRAQIDERLDQLARYQTELEDRCRQLAGRQLLPVWVLASLGGVFVVGVMLGLAGLLMPALITGSMGWVLAVLGLGGGIAAAGGKVLLERSNAQQLEACQKQLGVLQVQVQQTKEDRDRLDGQLPRGGGQISNRLQAAEKDLAELEELTPLDTRRNAARQEADAAGRRAAQAEDELKAAARRWRQAVAAVGLPEGIGPKHVLRLTRRCEHITEIQRRLAQPREDLTRRQRELDALAARIVQLAADAGQSLAGANPFDHLRQLAEAVGQQASAAARRQAVRRQARHIRAAQAKYTEVVGRLKRRRRALFFEAGADDEREFRQRAVRFARADALRRDRDSLTREIQAAIASHCSEEVLRQQIAETVVPAETRRDNLRQRLALLQQQLHGRLEKRGQIAEQLSALAADRQLAAKHLEFGVVEKRLEDAAQRWRVLAVTCRVLEMIRTTYEQHRQPETLREASGHLDRLTQGRYRRVWTPLGEKVLRVDDAEGNSLPVELLSRGTREQLFLSLRLALTNCYARRGAALPLVLDDVLVNFDTERMKAAAAVLRDFAALGHQLLVFTCHEHILRAFKALRVQVTQLPGNSNGTPTVIRLEHHGEEKARVVKESRPVKSAGEPAPARRKRSQKPKKMRHYEEPIFAEPEEQDPEVWQEADGNELDEGDGGQADKESDDLDEPDDSAWNELDDSPPSDMLQDESPNADGGNAEAA